MAQIDPSIALSVRPPQFESPLNSLAQAMQVQGMQQQGQMNSLKMDEYRQGVDRSNRLRSLLGQDYAGPEARESALLKGGFAEEAMKFGKDRRENTKADADAQKAQLESHLKKFEVAGQIMSGVRDQASWDLARQQTAQVFGPEAAARLPAQYDPALVEQNRIKAMSVKDQMEFQYKALTQAETARHNGATEGLTATGQQITIRGQDKTDQRARDFNAVQQDANNIKRAEKKETADLTKNSQIASFDTMLGTLDRLSTHPGLKRSVGSMSAFPTMPGSDSANFQAELNTFQSQAFLPMVAQLKGMGALSDSEGKKLTAAVGALDPKMGEEAFRASVTRITEDMEAARERMAGQRRNPTAATPPKADASAPKKIANDAEYNALPSGATFIGPDGKQRRKP